MSAGDATHIRLLFDMDGTLLDSTASVERHWRRWSRRHGLDDLQHVLHVVHGHRSIDAIRLLAPTLDAAAEAEIIDAEQAADARGVMAMPSARDVLAALREDGWAIVTSATRRLAAARLAAAGLPAPRVLVCAEDVAHGKPAPDGYRHAARQLGASADVCVV